MRRRYGLLRDVQRLTAWQQLPPSDEALTLSREGGGGSDVARWHVSVTLRLPVWVPSELEAGEEAGSAPVFGQLQGAPQPKEPVAVERHV